MRALIVFVIVVAVGSLAMFALYATIDISRSLGALAVLGGLAAVVGWLTLRAGVIAAPLAFYTGVLFWPSIIHMFCAPEGAVGSLIRARAWRRVLDRSAT